MVFEPSHRVEVKEITGSPEYQWVNSSITQNNTWNVNFFETAPTGATANEVQKYLPFNWFKIVNKSGSTLYFYINQDLSQLKVLPDNTVTVVEGVALHSFRIVPTTANASATTIFVSAKRSEMTSDKFFRDASKNVFVRALLRF